MVYQTNLKIGDAILGHLEMNIINVFAKTIVKPAQ